MLPDISKLVKLKVLPLNNNRIEYIGSWIGKLHSLERLDLSHNLLQEVPSNVFFMMKKLTYLNLKNNRLANLQVDFNCVLSRNSNIRILDLSHNKINYVPVEFKHLDSLKIFNLKGNPLIEEQNHKQNTEFHPTIKTLKEISANCSYTFQFNHMALLPESIQRYLDDPHRCNACFRYFYSSHGVHFSFEDILGQKKVPMKFETCSPICMKEFLKRN